MSETVPVPQAPLLTAVTVAPAVAIDHGNEEIVIEHPLDETVRDAPRHINHNRLVTCKKGTGKITIDPMLKAQGDRKVGHDERNTYLRSSDVDGLDRSIFRQEGV